MSWVYRLRKTLGVRSIALIQEMAHGLRLVGSHIQREGGNLGRIIERALISAKPRWTVFDRSTRRLAHKSSVESLTDAIHKVKTCVPKLSATLFAHCSCSPVLCKNKFVWQISENPIVSGTAAPFSLPPKNRFSVSFFQQYATVSPSATQLYHFSILY